MFFLNFSYQPPLSSSIVVIVVKSRKMIIKCDDASGLCVEGQEVAHYLTALFVNLDHD